LGFDKEVRISIKIRVYPDKAEFFQNGAAGAQ
jgi:hypothetical protein